MSTHNPSPIMVLLSFSKKIYYLGFIGFEESDLRSKSIIKLQKNQVFSKYGYFLTFYVVK